MKTLSVSKKDLAIGIFSTLAFLFCPPLWGASANGGLRAANTSLRLPSRPPASGFALTSALGGLTFDQPVCIASPPGETNRLFVLERTGRIMVVTNLAEPTETVFLDLRASTASDWGEQGLLGMAFHPAYSTNRYFYIYRTLITTTKGRTNSHHDQLSRFETSGMNPNEAQAGSEMRLIAQSDEDPIHNAGCVQFGPDGYLYVSLGYSKPPPPDRSPDPQSIDKGFFAGILRLDVDKRPGSLTSNSHPSSTTNYAIPPDNPFIGITNHNGRMVDPGRIRTEFYAIGLRNPWRMTFDSLTGLLLCADVGASEREEINVIERGGNYGWPYQEGSVDFSNPPTGSIFTAPLYEYPHSFSSEGGRCVIGGVVYRGAQLPGIFGAYLFSDYVSGSIWALRYQGSTVEEIRWLIGESGLVAFGTDPRDGEVLVANLHTGMIQKLTFIPEDQAIPFPNVLSDTGIFSDLATLTPDPGVLPYDINVPFWSDNASKRRWFSVPDTNASISFDPIVPWGFPDGTVWIKHFDLELIAGVPESARRIETRALVKNADGVYGVTYRWNESQTEAELVPANGADQFFAIQDGQNVSTQAWHFPGRLECLMCHTRKAGYALGFNTAQLAREILVEGNAAHQIDRLSQMGYFTTPVADYTPMRPLASSTNTAYPLGYRIHSYLTANCAQCHQPGEGPLGISTLWDARFEVPISSAGMINGILSNYGETDYRVIRPNSLEHSILFQRVSQPGRDRMPPLATTLIDSNAVAMLSEWIQTFPPDPWQSMDIGSQVQEGFGSISDGAFRVSGSGQGIGGTADSFQFLHQTVGGALQMAARLAARQIGSEQAQAGLMFRDGLAPDSPFVMIQQNPQGETRLSWRPATGGDVEDGTLRRPTNTNAWLKLVRQGNLVSGFTSDDGILWELLDRATFIPTARVAAGFAVSSRLEPAIHTLDFQNFDLMALTFSIASAPPFVAPASITLEGVIAGNTSQAAKVEFFANEAKVGEATSAPYVFQWNPVAAGNFVLTARVTNDRGDVLDSSPVDLTVNLPDPNVGLLGRDTVTQGNWQGVYGRNGDFIFNDTNRLPQDASIAISDNSPLIWADATSDERALTTSDGVSRMAAAWSAENELIIETAFSDGKLHQLTFYFLDWDGDNSRTETVELWDVNSGSLLHQETLSAFSSGVYLRWDVRGSLRIRIARQAGASAVLSGIFLDPYAGTLPAIALTSPPDNSVFAVPATVPLQAEVLASGAAIASVQFFANETSVGETMVAPYSFLWTNAWPGSYALTARVLDELGESHTSVPVSVTVSAVETKAVFVDADSVSQGNWIGRYGFNGFVIPAYVTNCPPFALVHPDAPEFFVWENPSIDARALQLANGDARIASCWHSATRDSISITVDFLDGKAHKVSLYLLDWERVRVFDVELLDASDGTLLDARSIYSAPEGVYYTWIGQGRIRFQLNRLASNVVLSGLFFDPLVVSSRSPRLRASLLGQPGFPEIELNLRGIPSYPYRIEKSTNMVDWMLWQVQIASTSGTINFLESFDPGVSTRFYRAVLHSTE
jgi:glucose/arabinose dehydrogenase